MTLYYNKDLENPALTVRISGPDGSGFSLKGLIESETSFTMSNQYTDGLEEAAGQASATGIMNAAANVFGKSQSLIKNISQTISQWSGTSKPQLPVTITLINTSSKSDIVGKVKKLMILQAPSVGMMSISHPTDYSGELISGGLSSSSSVKVKGTWIVEIGRWLRVDRLILLDANAVFSKEITVDGQPLYARVQLTFQPCILPDKDVIAGYFRS